MHLWNTKVHLPRKKFVFLAVASKGVKPHFHQGWDTSALDHSWFCCRCCWKVWIVGQRRSTASTTPFVWRKLCHGCVELGGQKWEHGHGDQDITSASCWDIYLNPSIQQCANSGPITEVPLRALSAFPILFLLGWKWESNLPFFFHVHLVNTSDRDHSYFICGVIQ